MHHCPHRVVRAEAIILVNFTTELHAGLGAYDAYVLLQRHSLSSITKRMRAHVYTTALAMALQASTSLPSSCMSQQVTRIQTPHHQRQIRTRNTRPNRTILFKPPSNPIALHSLTPHPAAQPYQEATCQPLLAQHITHSHGTQGARDCM